MSEQSTIKTELCNGVPIVVPNNTVDLPEKGCYISYNNYDTKEYGCATTALVRMDGIKPTKFLILNGNHMAEYQAIGNYDGCVEYFKQHLDQQNKMSENWNEEIITRADGTIYRRKIDEPCEVITREIIQNGLRNNIIQIINCENDGDIAAKIGDYWFYICSNDDRSLSVSEFMAKYTEESIIELIYAAINSPPIKGDTEDESTEWLYYLTYLIDSCVEYSKQHLDPQNKATESENASTITNTRREKKPYESKF